MFSYLKYYFLLCGVMPGVITAMEQPQSFDYRKQGPFKDTYLNRLPTELCQELKRFVCEDEPEVEYFWGIEEQLQENGKFKATSLPIKQNEECDALLSPDGKKIVVISNSHSPWFRILDSITGQQYCEVVLAPFNITNIDIKNSLDFDSSSQRLLVNSNNRDKGYIFNTNNGVLLHTIASQNLYKPFFLTDYILARKGEGGATLWCLWNFLRTDPIRKFVLSLSEEIIAATEEKIMVLNNNKNAIKTYRFDHEGKLSWYTIQPMNLDIQSSDPLLTRFVNNQFEVFFIGWNKKCGVWKEATNTFYPRNNSKESKLKLYSYLETNKLKIDLHAMHLKAQIFLTKSGPGIKSYLFSSDTIKNLSLCQLLILRDFYHHLLQKRPWAFDRHFGPNQLGNNDKLDALKKMQEVYIIPDDTKRETDPRLFELIKTAYARNKLELIWNSEFEKIVYGDA